jgi:hypothetical protein
MLSTKEYCYKFCSLRKFENGRRISFGKPGFKENIRSGNTADKVLKGIIIHFKVIY